MRLKFALSVRHMNRQKHSTRYFHDRDILVHWIPFMDTLATEIGCLPCRSLLFANPKLWMKLLIGPMTAFHYRLHGPGSKPEIAEAILMKLLLVPDLKICCSTWEFISRLLSCVGQFLQLLEFTTLQAGLSKPFWDGIYYFEFCE